MKRLFVTAIIFTFIVSLTSISYGFSLFISPSSYKATVAPGLSVTGDARITNEGNYPIGIKTDAQDWIYNEQGSKTFLPPGTNPFSCAKWIRLFPSKFKVEANSYRTTQFTINAPEDAEGGYYAVVFFESFVCWNIKFII